MLLDCSQSPYFSMWFLRLVCFDGVAAIFVCKSERDLGRVSKLPWGARVGVSWEGEEERRLPTPTPLSSLDTLPSSRLRKMAAAPLKPTGLESPTEK